MADLYQSAVEYYNNGDLKNAKESLLNLLKENNEDYDAVNFLGIICLYTSEFKEAISYFNKALEKYSEYYQVQYNAGLAYQSAGEYESALLHYKKTVELKPDYADAVNNLALVLVKLEKIEEAEAELKKMLKRANVPAEVYINLGNILLKREVPGEAVVYYQKAVELQPENYDYIYNYGCALYKIGRYEDAINELKRTLKLKPGHSDALNNLGIIYSKLRMYDKAEECFNSILNMNPEDQDAYFNLGYCYQETDKYEKAIELFKKAMELKPDHKSAVINIASLLSKTGNDEESKIYFNEVLKDDLSKAITFTNIGVAKIEQGKLDEAIEFLNAALKIDSSIVETRYNLSHVMLLKGDFINGWSEYAWRKKRKDFYARTFSKPELKEKEITGKRVLVYDEQGLGDSIQFMRYLKMLKAKGCYLIFECDSRLYDLYADHTYIDEIIVRKSMDEPEVEYDVQIALLSLPEYFETTLESIPIEEKYLNINEEYQKKWEHISDDKNIKIGLVWAGNPNHTGDKKRSISLKTLSPLFGIGGVKFFSLQKGPAVEQIQENNFPIINLDPYINNFMDTGAIIEKLDIVLTVDTSVAHLAGALGKAVWIILPKVPDWRWMLDRNDTPWYPKTRLFRQKGINDWSVVVDDLYSEIIKLTGGDESGREQIRNIDTGYYREKQKEYGDGVLYLGLSKGENFGWGVCSKYLKKELFGKIKSVSIDSNPEYIVKGKVDGILFNAIKDVDLNPLYQVSGIKNIGYTFFENLLTKKSIENAKQYDIVIGGSTFNKIKLEEAGIKNTDVLIQGVDPELFYPGEDQTKENLFVIFSGGKFELRKGQDLVLKAIKHMQQKYNNVILINAWYNFWPDSIYTMNSTKHINFEMTGNTWEEFMANLYRINGLDPARIITLPVTPNNKLRELYLKTDVGIFPNRCEGGTNLVLMEYMATGKPVLASYNSGHKDVLTNENSLKVEMMHEFKMWNQMNELTADWEEPDFDELIEKLEYAYNNRMQIKQLGAKAAIDMEQRTWKHTAGDLLKIIYG